MKTIYHQALNSVLTCNRLEILCYLIANQDQPVPVAEIAEHTGLPVDEVEHELEVLEGPLGDEHSGEGAYIHRARCSSQAVFIS